MLTLPLVSLPTINGEIKPGQHPNKPPKPRITPEYIGLDRINSRKQLEQLKNPNYFVPKNYPNKTKATCLISITWANKPAETAPCNVVAMVKNTKAAVELHPEYANARIKSP